MDQFPFGAVYKVQREHGREHIAATLNSMKAMGMNTVVIWPAVYWWEDPADLGYPFNTGRFILEHAGSIGLSVIMELAGQISALEYAPDFFMKDEYFSVNKDGSLDNTNNVFQYINYNHPDVRGQIRKHYREVTAVYKDYPALYGYDIWNETMFVSFDKYTMALYREWLKDKYSTLSRLNDVWDRSYTDWSQVKHETWQWASVMPYVDWIQFRKHNIGLILKDWKDTIAEVDDKHPVIADNIHSTVTSDDFYQRPQEDWIVASNVDEFGISFYPKGGWGEMPAPKRWRTFTGARSASGKARSFWISELQTHHRAMFEPGSIVYPRELRRWAWEAFVQGSKGIIFWKWDPFIKGIQTSGRGLVDYRGVPTQRAEEAQRIANQISRVIELLGPVQAEKPQVAIVYDSLSHDFSKAFTQNYREHSSAYIESISGAYETLWNLGIPCEFITPQELTNGDGNRYRYIFVTMQIRMNDSLATALKDYVQAGGTLVCDGKFGEVNDEGLLYVDNPGGPLNSILGYEMIDVDPSVLEFTIDGKTVTGYLERKLLRVINTDSVKILGTYPDGYPGLLATPVGSGRIYYTPTPIWYSFAKNHDNGALRILETIFGGCMPASAFIRGDGAEEVKAAVLDGAEGKLLVVFNYSNAPRIVEVQLPGFTGSASVKPVVPFGDGGLIDSTFDRATEVLNIHVSLESEDVAVFVIQ